MCQGKTLTNVQKSTGVDRVEVDPDGPDGPRVVIIGPTQEAIEAAREALEFVEERVDVEEEQVFFSVCTVPFSHRNERSRCPPRCITTALHFHALHLYSAA